MNLTVSLCFSGGDFFFLVTLSEGFVIMPIGLSDCLYEFIFWIPLFNRFVQKYRFFFFRNETRDCFNELVIEWFTWTIICYSFSSLCVNFSLIDLLQCALHCIQISNRMRTAVTVIPLCWICLWTYVLRIFCIKMSRYFNVEPMPNSLSIFASELPMYKTMNVNYLDTN